MSANQAVRFAMEDLIQLEAYQAGQLWAYLAGQVQMLPWEV